MVATIDVMVTSNRVVPLAVEARYQDEMTTGDEEAGSMRLDAGEVHLHCTIWGPPRGEVVLLLHGFPECGRTWHHVAPRLAREGYRVVAPDLRGYGASDCPRDVAAYATPHLVADVAGLVRAMGAQRAHVVGHDWGGVVAWWAAMLRPDVIDQLVIVNAPHPVAYAAAMRSGAQFRRGWYVYLFQLPWLPEWMLGRRDFEAIRRLFAKDGLSAEESDPCVAALRPSGARSGALAYYRAALRGQIFGARSAPQVIEKTALVLWGEKDHFLVPALAEPPRRWVPRSRVVRFPEATHWSHVDAAESVARETLAHIRAKGAS